MNLKSPPPLKDNPELGSFLNDVYIKVNNIPSDKIPATATTLGNPGDMAFNSTHFYICYGKNLWKRIALVAF